jgi:hypothetical protein
LDGHFMRFHSAVLTPRYHNILQQLAKYGMFFRHRSPCHTRKRKPDIYATELLLILQSDKARERAFGQTPAIKGTAAV